MIGALEIKLVQMLKQMGNVYAVMGMALNVRTSKSNLEVIDAVAHPATLATHTWIMDVKVLTVVCCFDHCNEFAS